jgi:hypothetical protein
MVWTVNDPAQMMEVSQPACTRASLGALRRVIMQAARWGVDAILTDMTKTWLELRAALDGTWGSLVFYRVTVGY